MEENLHRTISVTLQKGMEIEKILAILDYIKDEVQINNLVLLNDKELIFTKELETTINFNKNNQNVINREIW